MKPETIEKYWYNTPKAAPLWLRFLTRVFRSAAFIRRLGYRLRLRNVYRAPIPVIVVGNINVGGTGKTPLVAWLVAQLKDAGYRPGIISRGYGGHAKHWPQQVRPDSDPHMVGDEAVLLARHCDCKIAVGPDRVAAAMALVERTDVNVIVSDDGLQHYALDRDIEIVVIDGERRFGNGLCLPAGPLREPESRLATVDFRVVNGGEVQPNEVGMRLVLKKARSLTDTKREITLADFADSKKIHAVAGIGNPERFFGQLRSQKINLLEHAFPDHHPFTAEDLCFGDDREVLMTEKDAVKCERFAGPNHWYVPVEAELQSSLRGRLLALLEQKTAQRKPQWTKNYSTSSSAPSAKARLSTEKSSRN